MTYLMITSAAFSALWDRIVDTYAASVPHLKDVNLRRMASMILGVDTYVGDEARCFRQIVNGPFDADKLDYLPRDGYFTGLSTVVDIERLLYTVTVVAHQGKTELAVLGTGSNVLEQVIFAKTQLFSAMYHHHKVRAAHALLLRLLKAMNDTGYKPAGLEMSDPVSFAVLDDYDLLHSGHGNKDVDAIVSRIKSRPSPKRALVITYPCFDEGDNREPRKL